MAWQLLLEACAKLFTALTSTANKHTEAAAVAQGHAASAAFPLEELGLDLLEQVLAWSGPRAAAAAACTCRRMGATWPAVMVQPRLAACALLAEHGKEAALGNVYTTLADVYGAGRRSRSAATQRGGAPDDGTTAADKCNSDADSINSDSTSNNRSSAGTTSSSGSSSVERVLIELIQELRRLGAGSSGAHAVLVHAAIAGHLRVAQSAVHELGADVNAAADGLHAFSVACFGGDVAMVELLMGFGTRKAIMEEGFMFAAAKGCMGVVHLIMDREPAVVSGGDILPVAVLATYGCLEALRELHRRGYNLRTDDDMLLVMASWKGQAEVVQMLLQAGANPNAQAGMPLRRARGGGHTNVVELLVGAGAVEGVADGADGAAGGAAGGGAVAAAAEAQGQEQGGAQAAAAGEGAA